MTVDAGEAMTALSDLRERARTPLWVKDERWEVWHAWLTSERMTVDGHSRTACGDDWTWSKTTKTSYHVLALAGCYLCRLALEGTPVKRRGRPRHLPVGLPPIERLASDLPPISPTTPPRRKRRYQKRQELVQDDAPKEPTRAPQSRVDALIEAGAKEITYTRPDGKVVRSAHPDKEIKRKLAAVDADDVSDVPSFEVGTRLPAWECMQCGQTLAFGDRFCGRSCADEHRQQEQADRWERNGLIAARLHFEDVLYRRPRRDRIQAWTPPAKQIRKEQFPRASY